MIENFIVIDIRFQDIGVIDKVSCDLFLDLAIERNLPEHNVNEILDYRNQL